MTTPLWSPVAIKTAIKQAAHSAKTVKGKDQQDWSPVFKCLKIVPAPGPLFEYAVYRSARFSTHTEHRS